MSHVETGKRTVVLGASPKPDRYAYKAMQLLRKHGHPVVPVHPVHKEIEGVEVVPGLEQIKGSVHTVTVYLSSKASHGIIEKLVTLGPERVILNPGAESPELEEALDQAGIPWEHACTLVLLHTGQY